MIAPLDQLLVPSLLRPGRSQNAPRVHDKKRLCAERGLGGKQAETRCGADVTNCTRQDHLLALTGCTRLSTLYVYALNVFALSMKLSLLKGAARNMSVFGDAVPLIAHGSPSPYASRVTEAKGASGPGPSWARRIWAYLARAGVLSGRPSRGGRKTLRQWTLDCRGDRSDAP